MASGKRNRQKTFFQDQQITIAFFVFNQLKNDTRLAFE